jgi:ATP-dependent Lon protease
MKKFLEINYNGMFSPDGFDEDADFISIISDEEDEEKTHVNIPDILPILPLRNTVLFPGVVIPITVGREKSLKLIKDVYKKNKILGTIAQVNPKIENPESGDLFQTGTVAQILKILEMPDGSTSVIIQGRKRFNFLDVVADKPFLLARVEVLEDVKTGKDEDKLKAIVGALKDLSMKIIKLSSNIPPEATFAVKNIESPAFLINFLSSNNDMELKEKQKLLEINDLETRGIRLLEYLSKESQMLELKNDIQSKVKTDLDQQQREYLLHQQMKTIQDELGGNPLEQEIVELKEKGSKKK